MEIHSKFQTNYHGNTFKISDQLSWKINTFEISDQLSWKYIQNFRPTIMEIHSKFQTNYHGNLIHLKFQFNNQGTIYTRLLTIFTAVPA